MSADNTVPLPVTILPAAPSRALYSTGSASQGMDFPAFVLIHTMGAPQPLHVDFFILPPALLHPHFRHRKTSFLLSQKISVEPHLSQMPGRPLGPVGPWFLRMAWNSSRTTGHLVSVQKPLSLAWPQTMWRDPQKFNPSISRLHLPHINAQPLVHQLPFDGVHPCFGGLALHVLHHRQPVDHALAVRRRRSLIGEVRAIPDGPHPDTLQGGVCLLQRVLRLELQFPNLPGRQKQRQFVIPPGLLLAVKFQGVSLRRDPGGLSVVVLGEGPPGFFIIVQRGRGGGPAPAVVPPLPRHDLVRRLGLRPGRKVFDSHTFTLFCCPLKADLHLRWVQVHFRTPASSPAQAAGLSHAFPPSRPQACSVFALQDVGHQALISHCPGSPPGRRVKHGTCVPAPIRAKPVYLQGPSIIQVA
nr:MAG TPA: hypothetical protein [Caudoviricetes sp.]